MSYMTHKKTNLKVLIFLELVYLLNILFLYSVAIYRYIMITLAVVFAIIIIKSLLENNR